MEILDIQYSETTSTLFLSWKPIGGAYDQREFTYHELNQYLVDSGICKEANNGFVTIERFCHVNGVKNWRITMDEFFNEEFSLRDAGQLINHIKPKNVFARNQNLSNAINKMTA